MVAAVFQAKYLATTGYGTHDIGYGGAFVTKGWSTSVGYCYVVSVGMCCVHASALEFRVYFYGICN